MGNLNPGEAVAALERALRQLMIATYPQHFGVDWLEKVTTDRQRTVWGKRRTEEAVQRGRRGMMNTSDNLLDYSNLYDLIEIAKINWGPLHPALNDQKSMIALLRRADSLRNPVAHSRELAPFEEDLLSGIAGDVRNRVAVFMTSNSARGEFYARCDYISDNFGRTPGQEDGRYLASVVASAPELRPGDRVTITCRGVDPKSRPMNWTIHRVGRGHVIADRAIGNSVQLNWDISTRDVGDDRRILVKMWPTDAQYFRHPGVRADECIEFRYHVLPPI